MDANMPYNVMIVEDQALPRQLLEMLVKGNERYRLAYSLDSAFAADVYCTIHRIDLILMDVVTAGGANGLDAAARIKRACPRTKIIAITSMPEYSYIERARQAKVDSFWYKEDNSMDILEVMDRTMAGESIYPSSTPEIRLGNASSYELTERELEVLREMTTGATNAEIGEILNIAESTVKVHVKHLLEKTGFRSRTELAINARICGLVIADE
ncbi:MAG: response regulator transcription factor [Coriobacteriales bacterium]|nr:response regulator transcription factor [Coriobacteriales bacterium]